VKRCAEIRISKSEIRNNIKTMKTQRQNNVQNKSEWTQRFGFSAFEIYLPGFVLDFVLRISNLIN